MPALGTPPNSDKPAAQQAASNQLNQLIGNLVQASNSQSGDVVTALNALAAAITAKPSAS